MNVFDAIYHAVHDHPGSAQALAPRMGLQPTTLLNMANPRETTHGWSLRRFRDLLAFTGDRRPLDALCAENGGVFVPVPKAVGAEQDLLATVTRLGKEFGDVCASLNAALADGRVTPRELDDFRQQVYEMNQVAAGLEALVAARVDRRGHLKAAS